QTKISRRIVYAECAAQGKTIFQTKHKLAQQEIQQLTSEIVKLL
ncbi:MAG: hypothetical protein MRECE_51c001, partial [Mycoplasmataceae bacterium CE_OT135]